jgi:hypothetical protein
LVAEIDLRALGIKVPARGAVSATAIELLFISDSYLAVLGENVRTGPKNAHLMLFAIGEGNARQMKGIPLSDAVMPISSSGPRPEKVLERVDFEHFAYWTYLGVARRWLCNTNLNCREDKAGAAPIIIPPAAGCGFNDFLGVINDETTVCVVSRAKAKWSAVAMDSSGHHLYEVERGALPWDPILVSSDQGQRFGLEWKSNTALQLLNPLACLDECPPAGREQFAVFNSTDGRKLQDFKWDPRPYNLYAIPALSPSGKTAAFVRVDQLVIYSLDPPH